MIKTQKAQLADSTPVQLTFAPVKGVLVRFKNSGDHMAFVGGKDLTPANGFEIPAGKEDTLRMPDSYHLYGCAADGFPTVLQVMEISR